MLINQVLARSGAPSAEYNDLAWLVAPRAEQTGVVELQLARFGDLMLDNQFEDGSDGMLFEYELVYYPTTTHDGTPEGFKRPRPDRVAGPALTDLGDTVEAYRHTFQIKNNRGADDFDGIMRFAQTMGLTGDAFAQQIAEVIDVDQWLRAFAFSALSGAVDHYGQGARHNVQFYIRPADGRALYFPHDLDFYPGSPTQAIVSNGDLRQLLALPGNRRAFYGHLHDIMSTSYNGEYMAHWRDLFARLAPGQPFASHHQFMVDRAAFIRDGAADSIQAAFPAVAFEIQDGPIDILGPTVVVEGQAWIDTRQIRQPGQEPRPIIWLDETTWQVELPVPEGDQLTLEAVSRAGEILATDTVTLQRAE